MNGSQLKLDEIANRIREVLSKPVDGRTALTDLWKLRAEIEYATGILSLELEERAELERITKPLRLKKKDKDTIVNQINEVLLELPSSKENKILLFEKLWKLRELVTMLLKVSDNVYKKIKIGEESFNK